MMASSSNLPVQASSDTSAQIPTTLKMFSKSFLTKYQVDLPNVISTMATSNKTSGLPETYEVGPFDVVCGRGKGSYNRSGNKAFHKLVQEHVAEYIQARSKVDKSMVLNRIVEHVRSQDNGRARFIKQRRDKTWYEISDDQAREKVGHAIREAMNSMSTSSSSSSSRPASPPKIASSLHESSVTLPPPPMTALERKPSAVMSFPTNTASQAPISNTTTTSSSEQKVKRSSFIWTQVDIFEKIMEQNLGEDLGPLEPLEAPMTSSSTFCSSLSTPVAEKVRTIDFIPLSSAPPQTSFDGKWTSLQFFPDPTSSVARTSLVLSV